MGADFISIICEAPKDATNALRIITDKVLSLGDEDVAYLVDEVLGMWEGNDKRAILLQQAIAAYDHVSSYPRDMDTLYIKGLPYWFSGGMSWGDAPTDSFNKIWFLSELDIDWGNG